MIWTLGLELLAFYCQRNIPKCVGSGARCDHLEFLARVLLKQITIRFMVSDVDWVTTAQSRAGAGQWKMSIDHSIKRCIWPDSEVHVTPDITLTTIQAAHGKEVEKPHAFLLSPTVDALQVGKE